MTLNTLHKQISQEAQNKCRSNMAPRAGDTSSTTGGCCDQMILLERIGNIIIL